MSDLLVNTSPESVVLQSWGCQETSQDQLHGNICIYKEKSFRQD